MLGLQFTTTVTVIAKNQIVGYDKGNRPIYDDVETPSPGWVLWPQSTDEDTNAQDITTDILDGLAPNETDLSNVSQVKVPGFDKTFNVKGDPWPWKSPMTGTAPGIHVVLKAVD